MKVSAKGRYGLVAMTYLAQHYRSGIPITIMSLSKKLGISKIYLEQVFALLKRTKLIASAKGSQGGYYLIVKPADVTVYQILAAIEMTMLEETVSTSKIAEINTAINKTVYEPLDKIVVELFKSITLEDIVTATEKESAGIMYYI